MLRQKLKRVIDTHPILFDVNRSAVCDALVEITQEPHRVYDLDKVTVELLAEQQHVETFITQLEGIIQSDALNAKLYDDYVRSSVKVLVYEAISRTTDEINPTEVTEGVIFS